MKLITLFFLQFLLATTGFSSTFPRGCEVRGFGYHENFLILNEKGEQTFYLLQNRSNFPIDLEHHETKNAFMSPKLHSRLEPQQWAAFASDVEGLYFKCSRNKEGVDDVIKCADVLEVCQYPRVKFALSNMGNYWVSSNKSQAQVIKEATAKGIYLRW